MDFGNLFLTLGAFTVALSTLVFVHEWGHYSVARLCGVRVLVFSIGFGPELFGWHDKHGTRWCVSALPLGGYVKFFGDAGAASQADQDSLQDFTAEEQAVSFHHQPLYRRALIVAAGPAINFAFAILLFTGLFSIVGQSFSPPVAGEVIEGTPADQAGIEADDRFLSMKGITIRRFEDLVEIVRTHPGYDLPVVLERGKGQRIETRIVPEQTEIEDRFGNIYSVGRIGVRGVEGQWVVRGPLEAVYFAVEETWRKLDFTLQAMGQIILGLRPLDDLGGPVRIAKTSGEAAQLGLPSYLTFMALISISLGFVNLLPVPVLDGGHLLFYAIEGLKGSPLSVRMQELSYMAGLFLVLSLMIFVTWNDLNSL